HIVIDTNRPRDPAASLFCSNTAAVRGKPAVTTEVGSVGVPTEADVATNARGALRVMRHLDMLLGQKEFVRDPVWLDPTAVLDSRATGLWFASVRPDQRVARGDVLGHLTDYFGAPIAEVRAPLAGIVTYVVVSPAMTAGEPLAMVGWPSRGM